MKNILGALVVFFLAGCEKPDIRQDGRDISVPDTGEGEGEGEVDAGIEQICSGIECGENSGCDPQTGECRCFYGFVEHNDECVDIRLAHRACCNCLSSTMIPGLLCVDTADCPETGTNCWCTNADCTNGGQCGSYYEIGPNSIFDNAFCICEDLACLAWICGQPSLVGDPAQCPLILDSGLQITVRGDASKQECAEDCFFLADD